MKTPKPAQAHPEATGTATPRQSETAPRRTRGTRAPRPSLINEAPLFDETFPTEGLQMLTGLLDHATEARTFAQAIDTIQGLLVLVQGNPALRELHFALCLMCEGNRRLNEEAFRLRDIERRINCSGSDELEYVPVPPINIEEMARQREATGNI